MGSLIYKPNQSSFLHEGAQKVNLHNNFLQRTNWITVVNKEFLLDDDIQCICSIHNPGEDFHVDKMPATSEFFVLRIDEISQGDNPVFMANKEHHSFRHQKRKSILLLSPLEEFTFFAPGNSRVKTLEILIPPAWFLKQLDMGDSPELVKKYLAVRAKKMQDTYNNYLFRSLFTKIMNEADKEVSDFTYVEKKVKALLTIFCQDFSDNLNDLIKSEKVKIASDEIERLIAVRKYLEAGLRPPEFTSLTQLALMSSTSLKTKFKKMYGITIYEYFQSMRMQKARVLLLTHKYSVKQIGQQLGYSNLSNFTIAFKKEFNRLPCEFIK